jgi:hypothetical protein
MVTDCRFARKVRLRKMSALVRIGVFYAVLALVVPTAVPVSAQPSSSPVITSAQSDLKAGALTIVGTSLPASPQVMLSSLPLTVLAASTTEIVAELPADVAPASYLLIVYNTGKNATSA